MSKNEPISPPAQCTLAACPRLCPHWRDEVLRAGAGALLGVLLFMWLAGFQIVVPSNITWLFDSPDPTTHYLGWAFFRHDAWHLPLGLNPNYGMATGSSIVYSDSIPLPALVFKPFSAWLGEPFQYTGLWLLLCFILQGTFAMLVAGRVIPRLLPQALAAALLMLPFILLKRLDGHYALSGQWTILWALYLYFGRSEETKAASLRPRPRPVWILLICLAVLIHLYLAVLVLAIWCADLARRYLAGRRLRLIPLEVAVVLPALLGVMWLAGYFCLGFSDARTPNSAGAYSMNLLSFIDPRGFSRFLPALPLERPGQVEGAAYLGLGVLAMIPATLLIRPARARRPTATLPGNWTPLLIVCALLLLFAVSPVITCGSTRLLALPNYWGGISEVLRATGRMSWLAVYVLPLLLLATLASRLQARPLAAVVAAILLLQILDLSPMFDATRHHFHAPAPPIRTLSDPFWATVPQRYRQILLVPSDASDTDWDSLAFFAANHGMAINHGYFARMNWDRKEAANQHNRDDLAHGRLDRDSLYILCDPGIADTARSSLPAGARVIQADGYTLLAP